MNIYIVKVKHWFSGDKSFWVEALDKTFAKEKTENKVRLRGGGNYDINSVRVITKIKRTQIEKYEQSGTKHIDYL